MTPLFWALVFIVSTCESLSIGAAKPNVTKRETNTKNIYPDWVPFKSDKGELIEELVPAAKSKPKKRLAHPKNFVLKAVAEPQDDYYDKGQGDSDNEDYYEKKEWADLHRGAKPVDPNTPINHTNISDIEGIVNIITKPKDDPVLRALKARSKKSKEEVKPQEKIKRQNEEESSDENTSKEEKDEQSKESNEDNKSKKEPNKSEVETDYEEESAEKKKTEKDIAKEKEQKQSEAKKKKLLESVDALKERHAVEQRTISEKLKEDEIYKEELERDRIKPRENNDKYAQDGTRWKKLPHEYEEYEDQNPVVKDKYKLNPLKPGSITTTTTTNSPKTLEKRKPKKNNKTVASGKLSVFRNPQLYILNDDEDTSTASTTTEIPAATRTRKPQKFSSRYSELSTPEEDNVRISLVPENSGSSEDEPTLFFPKVKKNKRKFKNKQTTPVPDSTAFSSVEKEKSSEVTGPDSTAENITVVAIPAEITAPSASDAHSSASNTAVTASQSAPTAIAAPLAVDSIQAETHKKEQKKNEDFDIETGNGKHHKSEHDEIHDEHGKKAYEGIHKDTKSNKGHHDKENHLDKYNDHGGIDKSHHDEDNHYGSHHHEEHGKKHAKYEESGKHSKGHSTKGSHDIHKKEEYEKKVEFFEEEGDSDEEEFDGGHGSKKEHSSVSTYPYR
ncbi:jg6245 [Pararge aegeria aegeria]|uniref:Jg6245 protein n=1 Tax=Pararge aegeria aegeria TaxID=348720 RepID=A0A8S4SH52_9NEOP|nr:jg6245 [Pararge aegeria aegeria]